MQNNEVPEILDLTQLTWTQAMAHLQEDLNDGFEPGAPLNRNLMLRVYDIVGTMMAKLFEENPDIAERDMVVDYGIGSFVPGHLTGKENCAVWDIPMTFSYITCEGDEDEQVTVTTDIVTLTAPITIVFDLESGFHVALDDEELCRPLLPEDALEDVLDDYSISEYVDMLEDAFIEGAKDNLHDLPEAIGARIATEYCEEIGIEVDVDMGSEEGEGDGEPEPGDQ